ncbi:MAG TPA: Ig-like domain-containing protein, partial [Gemmatimonadaceae bacterium]
MHPIIRTIRTLVPPVLVGLQAVMLASCEPVQPLLVQKPFSPDSLNPSAYVSQYGVHWIQLSMPDSSLTTGQQVQVTGIPRDIPGNAIMQAPITWSITPTNVATISPTGLVTGGSTSGTATISATADGVTRSMTITVTATAPKPSSPVHMITITANASQLKIGQSTQVTGVAKDVNGTPIANVPITWSTSPATVATATTNSATTGTILGKGIGTATVYAKADTVTRQITITVIDSASSSSSSTPTQPVPPGGTGTLNAIATMATLPQATVNAAYPAPTRQVRVAAGANLQTAINAAQPGDELLLAPGATWTGNFTLPDKGSSTAWITIRTDVPDATLGTVGTRMTPSRAASARLAKILTPNNMGAIATALTAHHWRLTGLEIGGTAAAQEISGIVRFGDGSGAQNSLSLVAHDLVLDRAYVHGMATQAVRRCISLQSAKTAIVDSWISDCHSNNGDSQGIVGWNGPGPFLIQNNHIEGGHQGLFFGGSDPAIPNLNPSDITVIGNHITRPQSWKGVWQTKTIIESKNARRMLIEGNVIENVWPDAQVGYAVLLKSENQSGGAPWTQTTDVT